MRDAIAVSCMSAKDNFCELERCFVSIRQSCIDGCDTELETPKDRSVKRPSYDLDLRAPHSIVVFFGVVVETGTLLGCHVAVGKAIKIGADKVCCRHFGGEEELSNSSPLLASFKVYFIRARDESVGRFKLYNHELTPVSGIT